MTTGLRMMCVLLACLVPTSRSEDLSAGAPQAATPEFLSFAELKELARVAQPDAALAQKLNVLLATPFVGNDASAVHTIPHRPLVPGLGPAIRVVCWNIERGLNRDLIQSALANPEQFERDSGFQNRPSVDKEAVRSQLQVLKQADVLILNEVDLGMKRTAYRDVAHDLAAALHMNYAYGIEFVEVDPVFDLGIEELHLPDKDQESRLQEDLNIDPARYRGLHGNAVLSRYPIERARIVRLPVCYDWYGTEAKSIAKLEQGKRWSAARIFRERVEREVRRGGRMALIVDLPLPDSPGGKLVAISVHLENKCPPACRQRQMKALLNAIQPVQDPVIVAGDLNTSGSDSTPTSVRNEIMKRIGDYRFWVSQAIFWFSPVNIPQYAIAPLRYFHKYRDPTARHVPFVWENRERGLFQSIEKFRFNDGFAFDFRGSAERTLNNKPGTLANSNQRGSKGFLPTYAFENDFGGWVGNFKLDWFFVKPFISRPRDPEQSYRLAPHFPITMNELNQSVEDRISDHPPMTVDLPLEEPPRLQHGSQWANEPRSP